MAMIIPDTIHLLTVFGLKDGQPTLAVTFTEGATLDDLEGMATATLQYIQQQRAALHPAPTPETPPTESGAGDAG